MRRPILLLCCWAAALAGCAESGPDVHAEAEALVQQGKLEEAAARVDLTCVFAPAGDPCRASDRRAAELRIQGAEKAMGEGRFVRAERLFIRALTTAHAPTAESASQGLASEDLKQGLAYERALAGTDKRAVMKVMEAILATRTPVAAQAKVWADRERPGLLVEAVKAACGPAPEGSCSKLAAELRAAAPPVAGAEEAIALADAEERRIYPQRLNAETFLRNFAARSKIATAVTECKAREGDGTEQPPICSSPEVFNAMTIDFEADRIEKGKMNEMVWRRTMASIADPALVADLEARKKQAIATGAIEKLDVPRPRPAPKK